MKIVNILGSEYTIVRKTFNSEPAFRERCIDGMCDYHTKRITYCNMISHPDMKYESEKYCKSCECYTLRHEITHAFLSESGLAESSACYTAGWAMNEEMVDWFAIQAPKILNVFLELGLIPDEENNFQTYDGYKFD